ncbi:unnamed protein product [Rotaria sordida]|uniref:Uncharacterized protein n=1 Tax=Rotaria sordida TaxID=392033 RepID=A0A815I8C6_9BILA|nr:unnamed protein product [Rotaria sordida]CAF1439940.1 unnamed protein product [Rotaria sordida]
MVWLGVCSEGLTTPMILEDGTMDTERTVEPPNSSDLYPLDYSNEEILQQGDVRNDHLVIEQSKPRYSTLIN